MSHALDLCCFLLSSYTHALDVADVEEAVYYSNRAACKPAGPISLIARMLILPRAIDFVSYSTGWQNMSPPRYEKVLEDCNDALKLDPA